MTENRMTKTEQNQVAAIVGIAVMAILFTIFPFPREWLVEHISGGVTYAYTTYIAPVCGQVAAWIIAAWDWLDGLLPW